MFSKNNIYFLASQLPFSILITLFFIKGVVNIHRRALQMQTEHIHIQTTVNLQTTIDY